MNEKIKNKLEETKNKIKRHAPEIAFATIAVVATTYAIILKNRPQGCSDGETLRIAINDEEAKRLLAGGVPLWKFDNHVIDLAYDPDC